MNYKYKSSMTKKKAFTLIELLIVIAIIGILFIVLVSKVDFATDKAKATGVQTDFRSFQMAFETVSKEKAGFNSFGWNTGDANANGVRDSVDEGDANEDGVYQSGETWTGHKKYLETWTNTYSLIKPGTTFAADGYDKDAIFALETAINKNLDPTLHITIDAKTGKITMANGAQDPWDTQYHGAYISAEDGMDRGAIVMYSNGANQKFGSEHDIANGVPTVIVPGNNKNGADDYSMVVVYTYTNGFGEVGNLTTGFSNNQMFLSGNGTNETGTNNDETPQEPEILSALAKFNDGTTLSWDELMTDANATKYTYDLTKITDTEIKAYAFKNCTALVEIILPDEIVKIGQEVFKGCTNLKTIKFSPNTNYIGTGAFQDCSNLNNVVLPENIKDVSASCFQNCSSLTQIVVPDSVTSISFYAFSGCTNLTSVTLSKNLSSMGLMAFAYDSSLASIVLPDSLTSINSNTFDSCTSLKTVVFGNNFTSIGSKAFSGCIGLEEISIPATLTNIGQDAFKNCTQLKSVYISDLAKYCNITFTSLWSTPTYYDANLYLNGVLIEELVIPESVTIIKDYSFQYCQSFKKIVMHDNVTSVGRDAFYGCRNVSEIGFSQSLTYIGIQAFSTCSSLQSIVLPDSVTTLDQNAFMYCSELKSVVLGNNVKTIGRQAFCGAEKLETFIIPKSVETIEYAFSRCDNLLTMQYLGTMEEWDAIDNDFWSTLNGPLTVECTDGDVKYNQ